MILIAINNELSNGILTQILCGIFSLKQVKNSKVSKVTGMKMTSPS